MCCKKLIVLKKRGHMPGFAKHLAKKLGGDPDFFTKCMADDETAGYDDAIRKALCAKAHKLAIGRWPVQDPESERGMTKKKKMVILKGGAGSGFHGHSGRPGEVGGSTSESGDVSFSDAADKLLEDVKSGNASNYDWKIEPGIAKVVIPDGMASITVVSERHVIGKDVAGTTSQQRYKVSLRLTISKVDPSNERTGYSRYTTENLVSVNTKSEGLAVVKDKMTKRFDAMFK